MTVAELIAKLQKCKPDSEVKIWATEVPFDVVAHADIAIDNGFEEVSGLVFVQSVDTQLLVYDTNTDWNFLAKV